MNWRQRITVIWTAAVITRQSEPGVTFHTFMGIVYRTLFPGGNCTVFTTAHIVETRLLEMLVIVNVSANRARIA